MNLRPLANKSVWSLVSAMFERFLICFLLNHYLTMLATDYHYSIFKLISSIFCRVFDLVRALENDVARLCPMNSVRTSDAQ